MKDIYAAGLQVVAISYDSQEKLAAFAKKKEVKFPVLSDPDSKTITAFGILNERNAKLKVPHPTTFIVGKDQKIIAKLGKDGYRERHSPADLIKAMKSASDESNDDSDDKPESNESSESDDE